MNRLSGMISVILDFVLLDPDSISKDVDPLELYRALLRDGIEAPELLSANAVGVQVLPMGWS